MSDKLYDQYRSHVADVSAAYQHVAQREQLVQAARQQLELAYSRSSSTR